MTLFHDGRDSCLKILIVLAVIFAFAAHQPGGAQVRPGSNPLPAELLLRKELGEAAVSKTTAGPNHHHRIMMRQSSGGRSKARRRSARRPGGDAVSRAHAAARVASPLNPLVLARICLC